MNTQKHVYTYVYNDVYIHLYRSKYLYPHTP